MTDDLPQELFHVTRVENRESIRQFGLDWNRMTDVRGIAGSRGPEMAAVFVCEEWSIDFFCRMSETPLDVWTVDVDGLPVDDGPDGWWIVTTPIEPTRLRLAQPDVPGTPWPIPDGDEGAGIGFGS